MSRHAFLGALLAVTLGTAGCQNEKTEPMAPRAGSELMQQSTSTGRYHLDRNRIKLPASARMADREMADVVRRAIDPNDYACPPSTPLIDWFFGRIDEVATQEPAIFDLLFLQLAADAIPTYEAYFFETADTPQYFGYNGEYTHIVAKTERDVKRFWDIFSDDIQVVPMHGSVLLNEEKTAATYELLFGLDHATAALFASLVHNALLQSQTLNGGNHPIFTFNAFAVTTNGGSIPDKIIMGDGVLEGYKAIGFDDVAPQAVFAHEFGHHIQFERGYFDDPIATAGDPPEQTRYTELMADAFSAYYLTHKRGAALNRKRVEEFLQVFFDIGDCAFDNPGHHGTPNLRMKAAQFGFDVADQAQKQGHILTADQFHALFVAAYADITAPDAT
jgi:hypothetical protein